MAASYPEPPWHTHGFGVTVPYAVPRGSFSLPEELEPVTVGGRCLGLLSYVRYDPPSPLTYDELIWMPSYVRPRGGGRARGYYVAVMYVDDPTTLVAGREIWALPKTMAAFERRDDGLDVAAEDGTELSLRFRRLSPAAGVRGRMATLQVRDGGVLRFRADFRARVALASARVTHFRASTDAWGGFAEATRLPGPASMLVSYDTTMQPPAEVP